MQTGLDRLADGEASVRALVTGQVALLAHAASVSRALVHAEDVLAGLGIRSSVIFGPEHGYGGEAQDLVRVEDACDVGGRRIRSLYGTTFSDLSPRAEDLAGLDVLLVDLQDVGARYYTFVWTGLLALRACAKRGVRVLVFDRPNPLGCDLASVEGQCQTFEFRSFVGLEPVPVRHALTLGEILAACARADGIPFDALHVVRVRGLPLDAHATDWDRPFVMPSPNMPSYATALVYPGGCLVEGTNLSEGRGTTRPFEIVGAPWLDGAKLARDLHDVGLPGFVARPLTFCPTFHKHAGQVCGGVQIHPLDAAMFRPFATYLALIALARAQAPDSFRFRTEKYEFVDDIPAFDLLTGDARARAMIEAGADPGSLVEAIACSQPSDLDVVREARESAEFYFV